MSLHISSDQLAQFDRARDRDFVEGMTQYLVSRFRLDEQRGYDFGSISREVAPMIAEASKLGLPRYDGCALHVLASFILGVDYHETPTVKPVLHSEELSGDLKTLWLDRWFYSLEDAATKQVRA